MLGKAASRRHGQASLAQKRSLQAVFQRGPAAATEQAARQLIGHYPQEGYAWKVLGIALQQQGRLADALAALQQAVACGPRMPKHAAIWAMHSGWPGTPKLPRPACGRQLR